jgi:hypothetical protein
MSNEQDGLSIVPEVDLVFTVPYTDFSLLDVEVGLIGLTKYLTSPDKPVEDRIAMEAAYKVLLTVQHCYVETCGVPEKKEPNLLAKLHPLEYRQ